MSHRSSEDEENDRVKEVKSPYIKSTEETVELISPTFGDSIKIRRPSVRFGSSVNALKDLKHVEAQIKDLSIMPDFGYAEDNYLIGDQTENKWKMLTGLLGDPKKFSWLMNYLTLSKLETEVK